MKKVVISILLFCTIAVIIFVVWYRRNIQMLNDIKKFNNEFEEYLNKEISGVDLTTVMNKAIENNHQHDISKNSDGTYKNDEKYSIEIFVQPENERKVLSNGSL